MLDRKEIADRLTSIIRGQEAPFVISLDGRWGTGKTFLLKRWQQDLENQGWQAIYYNAWEDDFAGDPLLSITGQLSEHLEKTTLFGLTERAKLGGLIRPLRAASGPQPLQIASTGAFHYRIMPTHQGRGRLPTPPRQLTSRRGAARAKLKEVI